MDRFCWSGCLWIPRIYYRWQRNGTSGQLQDDISWTIRYRAWNLHIIIVSWSSVPAYSLCPVRSSNGNAPQRYWPLQLFSHHLVLQEHVQVAVFLENVVTWHHCIFAGGCLYQFNSMVSLKEKMAAEERQHNFPKLLSGVDGLQVHPLVVAGNEVKG